MHLWGHWFASIYGNYFGSQRIETTQTGKITFFKLKKNPIDRNFKRLKHLWLFLKDKHLTSTRAVKYHHLQFTVGSVSEASNFSDIFLRSGSVASGTPTATISSVLPCTVQKLLGSIATCRLMTRCLGTWPWLFYAAHSSFIFSSFLSLFATPILSAASYIPIDFLFLLMVEPAFIAYT